MIVATLSTTQLTLSFDLTDGCLRLLSNSSWLSADSPLFAVYANDRHYDAANLVCHGVTVSADNGIQHAVARFSAADFEVEHHTLLYPDTALIEQWQVIRAIGTTPLCVTRLDSFACVIPPAAYELLRFTSDWGQEFEPVRAPLSGEVILETRFGRSSKGMHPWFALFSGAGVLSGSVAWSGNWITRFQPGTDGGYHVSGGLHDWEFAADVQPGASVESAHAILALGNDLDDAAQQYARVGRHWWYPRNALSASQPVEWNGWWCYEDVNISESVFLANVEAAAQMGVEVCTMDAGWFGSSDASTKWYEQRGDWDRVNRERFPNGIKPLADAVHAHAMKFGLWCEIEALGIHATLAETHPEFAALRDGEPLNAVCFGSPAVQEWAFQTLSRLIRENVCDWIKLDFNLDPGAGCNRADHGHGADDGLYAHVQGYYRTLERLRAAFPEVVLENCSSGGLRIDLGILRRTDMTFLSDPDYPVHSLQVFWGATTMLAPDACLHWSFGEWRPSSLLAQNFNPRDPNLQPHQFDYYTRIAMLGAFGFSQKLPDLPGWVRQRLTDHVRIYRDHVRRFVRAAALYRLTDQPRRSGDGERWCAFQYSLPDEHLLFVFRLPGAEAERAVRLKNLQPNGLYQIADFEGERYGSMTGRELMERGFTFSSLPEEDSALLHVF